MSRILYFPPRPCTSNIFPERRRPRNLLVPLLSFRMSAAVKKRTSPQDWIHDYYGPVLTVLASEDAEVAFTRNIFKVNHQIFLM